VTSSRTCSTFDQARPWWRSSHRRSLESGPEHRGQGAKATSGRGRRARASAPAGWWAPTGGKKRPEVITAIEGLMKHDVAGDPLTGARWTRRTTEKISNELCALDIQVKNPGTARRRTPELVSDHNFRSDAEGIAIPYGGYDVRANRGTLFLGTSHDTPDFAVDNLIRWWRSEGRGTTPVPLSCWCLPTAVAATARAPAPSSTPSRLASSTRTASASPSPTIPAGLRSGTHRAPALRPQQRRA
jgi:hypothetical protein